MMTPLRQFRQQILPLIKPLQTGLLLVTGLAGYMSARCPVSHFTTILSIVGSLFLAISGSTILNMVYDRDIDAVMSRTRLRPIASGTLSPQKALVLGSLMSLLGIGWSVIMDPLYGMVVFAGLFFDVTIYTIWLKRRTSWSVVWGGIAGGMPVLAGRALGMGQVDLIGVLLTLAVLFWIPTHILTFGIKYAGDYQLANVPVFANTHGVDTTRKIIGGATTIAVMLMASAATMLGIAAGCMWASIGLGCVLLILTLVSIWRPTSQLNFKVFKFASLYMLGCMSLIIVGV